LQVAALAAVFLSRALSCGLLAPAIPEISREFGVSYDQVGSLIALLYVGYTLTVLVAGRLADRIGRLPLLYGGAILNGLCTLAVAFAPGTGTLEVILFLFGVAGVGDMTATVVLADSGSGSNGRVLSYGHSGYAIGAVVAPLVAGWAFGAGIGYRTLFLATSGLNALVVLGVAAVRLRERPHAPAQPGKSRSLLRSPTVLLGLAAGFLYIASEAGTVMWMPTFLQDRHQMTPAVASAALSVFWILMAFGRIVLARPVDRARNRMGLLALLFLLGGASYAVGLATDSAALAFACVAATGLFYSVTYPLLQSCMTLDNPGAAGTVIGLLATGAGLSGALSQRVVGALADRLGDGTAASGLVAALWLVPVGLVAGALAALCYRKVRAAT